jgi:hypothetical protein
MNTKEIAAALRDIAQDLGRLANAVEAVTPDVPESLLGGVTAAIAVIEDGLFRTHGRRVRSQRLRNSITKNGEIEAVRRRINSRDARRYLRMMKDDGHVDLSFEQLALDHADLFDPKTIETARASLAAVA